jgi:hypothetical protein
MIAEAVASVVGLVIIAIFLIAMCCGAKPPPEEPKPKKQKDNKDPEPEAKGNFGDDPLEEISENAVFLVVGGSNKKPGAEGNAGEKAPEKGSSSSSSSDSSSS